MWARERRVWASGGEAPASPGLVHTVRRTALGPKDASTSSSLGVAKAVVVVSTPPGTREELARAGGTPPGRGRCSFAMRRGLPASNTLGARRKLPFHLYAYVFYSLRCDAILNSKRQSLRSTRRSRRISTSVGAASGRRRNRVPSGMEATLWFRMRRACRARPFARGAGSWDRAAPRSGAL